MLGLVTLSCASRVLQYDKAEEVLRNEEYEQKLKVAPVTPPAPAVLEPSIPPVPEKPGKKTKKAKVAAAKVTSSKKAGPRQPEIEDSLGFAGRRPLKDPFRPGEKVTLALSYFKIEAGIMEIAVKPMVQVNGEKAYHFEVVAKSSSFFNHIYGVDDLATTYLLYDQMIPINLQITIKESKQLAEARTFLDSKTNKASYWQKRVTKEHGEESKKLDWDILPYSQNVISAAYYLRSFQYEVSKRVGFRVADEGKNIVFTGEVLRREKLDTDIGELDTIVLKPHIMVDGAFAPVGEILVWLTDDDRKFIVRIESKIKIGTIVAKLRSLEKGQDSPP